ncbi:MAG: hypothetical protein JKY37_17070 [Nannocystaceae bacterium]|nr:hypothetical protein [Nannocystaceae bacterium]
MPELEGLTCDDDEVSWAEGHCVSQRGTGRLAVTLTLAPDLTQAADIVTRLFAYGGPYLPADLGALTIEHRGGEPFCARMEALSLSRGRRR